MLKTDGQRLLCARSERGAAIAKACGCSGALVSLWRSGKKSPGPGHKATLASKFGIAVQSWERRPTPPQDTPLDAGRATGRPPRQPRKTPPSAKPLLAPGAPTIDAQLDALDAKVDATLAANPDTATLAKLASTKLQIVRRRDAFRSDADRYWDVEGQGMTAAVFDMIGAYPDAFLAVAAWMRAQGGLDTPEATEDMDRYLARWRAKYAAQFKALESARAAIPPPYRAEGTTLVRTEDDNAK